MQQKWMYTFVKVKTLYIKTSPLKRIYFYKPHRGFLVLSILSYNWLNLFITFIINICNNIQDFTINLRKDTSDNLKNIEGPAVVTFQNEV